MAVKHALLRTSSAAVAVAIVLAFGSSAARAGTLELYSCSFYGDAGAAFQGSATNALKTANECSAGRSFEINQLLGTQVLSGYGVDRQTTTTSSAIEIVSVWTPQVYVDCTLGKDGFFAEFYWNNGGPDIGSAIGSPGSPAGSVCTEPGFSSSIAPSRTFGWWAGCENGSSCQSQAPGLLGVSGVSITAEEDTAPSIIALGSTNVWYTGTFPGNPTRWIRGVWPASVLDSDPSGVSDMTAGFDNQPLQGPSVGPTRTCGTSAIPTAPHSNGRSISTRPAFRAAWRRTRCQQRMPRASG